MNGETDDELRGATADDTARPVPTLRSTAPKGGFSCSDEGARGVRRRRPRRVFAVLGIVLAITAGAGLLAVAMRRTRDPSRAPTASAVAVDVDAGFPDFGSTMSKNVDATEAYRSAMRAQRDANRGEAARKLDAAIAPDRDFAAAHLRRARARSRSR